MTSFRRGFTSRASISRTARVNSIRPLWLSILLSTSLSAQESNAETAAEGSDSERIADVVITAQRRTESVQQASIEIDVVGAEALDRAGVVSAFDLNRLVPGLQISKSGQFTQTYVRGVGTTAGNQYGDPTVTFNQDGVVIDRPNAVGPMFYDLARVEVLKGPQGTLYGRNATGGAINVISQAPTDRLEGFISTEFGNYDSYNATGALNLPLSDALSLRGSTLIQGRSSYLKGGFPAESTYASSMARAGRLQALWKPSADLSLRMIGEASNDRAAGDGMVLISPNEAGSGDQWLGAANPAANAIIQAANPNLTLIRSSDNRMERDLWNVGLDLNWNFGLSTLTVIPAYRHAKTESVSYENGNRLEYDESSKQKSVEMRWSRESTRYKSVLGAFYFDNDREVRNYILTNPINQEGLTLVPDIGSKSWAGFADATVTVADGLRALGGLRYTSEKKTLLASRFDIDATPTNNFVMDNRRVFHATTWRFGLEYDLGPQSMGFATVARGFKSGGFYTAPSPGNQFNPEILTAYTLGVRNRFLNDRLQVNAEAFHWRYKDNQQSFVGFDGQGNVSFVTVNAGQARLSGFSTDVIAKLSRVDTLSVSGEYVDSKYTKFDYVVPALIFSPASTGCVLGEPFGPPGFGRRRTVDCSGFALPRAAKVHVRMGYDHDFLFREGSMLTFAASGNYASSQWLTIDYLPQGRIGAKFTGDIDLRYARTSGNFSVSAFVHNVTDEATFATGFQNSSVPGVFYGMIEAPRTFGARAQWNF